MQAPPPTDQAEAPIPPETGSNRERDQRLESTERERDREDPIPPETVSNDENMNHSAIEHRKAAKRTLPWDLEARELELASPQPPQDEDIPTVARKKPRLEEPLSTTPDEAATKTASPVVSVGLPPPPAAAADVDVDFEPVMDAQPNDVATGYWTPEEDSKLKDAVRTNSGKDWAAIAALVPGRTRVQCRNRWHNALNPSIALAAGRDGKWAEDEDIKLKDAVQTHGGKNWIAISALVSGRTKKQCCKRWHNVLEPSIGRATGSEGKWTADEDSKLKDAVRTNSGKDWAAIAALVPGRTRMQCRNRWHNVLNPSIALAAGRDGKWAEDEDRKLKDAVQTHGSKNWIAISALVSGRTKKQCCNRWHNVLEPSIGRATGSEGKWTEDEDRKLKDAVQTHGGKNWIAISALVSGRTKKQCCNRWRRGLDPSIDQATELKGVCWTAVEDNKLKNAVQTHCGKNWAAIAALFPGRTKGQCSHRWHNALNPSIDRLPERTGKWAEDEDIKLKDAVLMHDGSKNWAAIAALVLSRTQNQCCHRWKILRRKRE
jgi:hypothetical protein